MQRLNRWIPFAGWGLAVVGAMAVFVSGGCGLLRRVINGPPQPPTPVVVPDACPTSDTRPLPSP